MNSIVAIVIFAIVALVILVNLYNVLGRKTGFRAEDKPVMVKGNEDGEAMPRLERPAEPRLPNLDALKTRDTNFNEINFLEKARETYEQVVLAFHRGELDAVRDRLSERVLKTFSDAIAARDHAPIEVLSFVDTPKADFDVIDFKDDSAQIRVRFLSELAYETPAEATPEAVEGAPPPVPSQPTRQYKRTAEFWTFQKAMKTPSAPWLLTRVEAAKA